MKSEQLVTMGFVLVVAGVAFFGGMQYQKTQVSARFGQFNVPSGGTRGMGARGNVVGMRPVTGEIISVDSSGITVKLQDGSSKIIIIPDTVEINKAAQAAKTDLTSGQSVMVIGTTNSDGSVTASNIQLNPQNRFSAGDRPTESK